MSREFSSTWHCYEGVTVMQLNPRPALVSYVGVVPRMHQSRKRRFSGRAAIPLEATPDSGARYGCRSWSRSPQSMAQSFLLASATPANGQGVAMIACMHKLLTAIYVSQRTDGRSLSAPVEVRRTRNDPSRHIWITSKRERDLSFSRRCSILHFEVTPGVESKEAAAMPTANDLFVYVDLEPPENANGLKHPAPVRVVGARRIQ
jgi:hypothetical protein